VCLQQPLNNSLAIDHHYYTKKTFSFENAVCRVSHNINLRKLRWVHHQPHLRPASRCYRLPPLEKICIVPRTKQNPYQSWRGESNGDGEFTFPMMVSAMSWCRWSCLDRNLEFMKIVGRVMTWETNTRVREYSYSKLPYQISFSFFYFNHF